ncbi:hypothetical protein [Actinoplanes aureus]|uniref:Uncharacterized protein n=1 Tax=Actinoplanes aureus TaxID=2792083 RepID=A0A931FZK7_9ACTN|nr:hypothetical protein [Actinoplanes aureus]MBG0564867.1 hypothetical protein [Actinoplanes aureus]
MALSAAMQSFTTFKDLIAVAIAALAVVLSLITVIVQRRQQQREAYRQVQDVLMSETVQRGRWMVIDIGNGDRPVPARGTPDFYLLNRTLGVYDTLAMYVRRKVVPRKWVLDMWHHPLKAMRPGAEKLAQRHLEIGLDWRPWPELWSLLKAAEGYETALPCCTEPADQADEPPWAGP